MATHIRSPRVPLLRLSLLAAASLLLAMAPAATAQLLPDGPLVDVGGIGLGGTTPGGADLDGQRPWVAMDAQGGFIVFWFEAEKSPAQPRLLARRYAPDGTPMWQEREYWDPIDGVETVGGLADVAMNHAGDFAIVWVGGEDQVFVRVFDECGDPLGPIVDLGRGPAEAGSEVVDVEVPVVALTADRIAVVGWIQDLEELAEDGNSFASVVTQRVQADGTLVGPVERITSFPVILSLQVAAAPDGGYGVVVESLTVDPAASDLFFALFDAAGTRQQVPGPPVVTHASLENPDLAVDGSGTWMISFTDSGGQSEDGADGSCTGVFGRLLDAAGAQIGTDVQLDPRSLGCQGLTRISALDDGWVVGWIGAGRDDFLGTDGADYGVYLRPYRVDGSAAGQPLRVLPGFASSYSLAAGGDRAAVAAVMADETDTPRVVVRLLAPVGVAGCTRGEGEGHLCLQGDRFRVDADYQDPYNGGAGLAFAQSVRDDSGALWFFKEENLELLVKVLDGRPVDGNWWVFYGALSTVEYWIAVTDLETGEQNVYHNEPFVQASVADTSAFAGGAGTGAATAPVVAQLPDRPVQELGGPQHVTGELTPPFCGDGPTQLCLQQQQFLVTVEWTDPRSGNSGTGGAVPLTSDTGAFWFFNEENLELMVKVLDGRPVNGHWWVIYAGLSDVEYTITVDWAGGGEAVYLNDPFVLNSGADTTAFED